MDSYRVEKKAAMKIQLPDENAEIEPVPMTGGGHKAEPELDRLSNILKTFNDQFGNIPWTDAGGQAPVRQVMKGVSLHQTNLI
jgi:type I restriction enzyme, R subunit